MRSAAYPRRSSPASIHRCSRQKTWRQRRSHRSARPWRRGCEWLLPPEGKAALACEGDEGGLDADAQELASDLKRRLLPQLCGIRDGLADRGATGIALEQVGVHVTVLEVQEDGNPKAGGLIHGTQDVVAVVPIDVENARALQRARGQRHRGWRGCWASAARNRCAHRRCPKRPPRRVCGSRV